MSATEISRDPRLRAHQSTLETFEDVVPDVITIRLMDDVDLLDLEKARNPAEMPDSIRRAREAGQVVLCDLDDDVWNIPDWNPAKRNKHQVSKKSRAYDLDCLEANIAASDGVMVTTPHVAEMVEKHVPGANVWVMRNGIDPKDFEVPHRKHKRLRVGWMAPGYSYWPHLEPMVSALSVLDEFDAEFAHLGWTPETDERTQDMWAKIPCENVIGLEWTPFEGLAKNLATCDVAIIPRLWSGFVEGHSHSSGLEWACASVPFLVQHSMEYQRLSSLGAGVVCTSLPSWELMLRELLGDAEKRKRLAVDGKKAAIKHHGLAATGRAYHELFTGLLAR